MSVVKIRRQGGVVVQSCDVYIGRAMYQGGWQLSASKWANPFKIGSEGIPNAEAAVANYWIWLNKPEQKHLLDSVSELKGKVLGCWCKVKGPEPCHGDVLSYLANEIVSPSLRYIFEINKDNPLFPPLKEMSIPFPNPVEEKKAPPPPSPAVVTMAPALPSPEAMSKARVLIDRVRGGMVALALGDALGSPFEMGRGKNTPYTGKLQYPIHVKQPFKGIKTLDVGSISDDTEMTLALARQLIADQHYDMKKVCQSYIAWANSGCPTMGKNTRELLKVSMSTKADIGGYKHYEKSFEKKFGLYPTFPFNTSSSRGEAAQSNGALMRCFPLACVWTNECILKDVWLTNPSKVVLECVNIQVHCLRMALTGSPAIDIWTTAQSMATLDEVKSMFEAITKGAQWSLKTEGEKGKGWVVYGLYSSMTCLAYLATDSPPSFSHLMQWVIEGHPDSDTDTNACIAGALIGAIIGWDKLIEDPQTLENIQIMIPAGDCKKPRTESEPCRPTQYRLEDVEWIVQWLTALSGVDEDALLKEAAEKKTRGYRR